MGHYFHIITVFLGSYNFLQVTVNKPHRQRQHQDKILTLVTATRGSTCVKTVMQVTATRGGTCYSTGKFVNRLIGMNSLAVLLIQLFLSVSLAEGFLHIARHHHHTSPASPLSNATVSRVKRAETNTGLSFYLLLEISLKYFGNT